MIAEEPPRAASTPPPVAAIRIGLVLLSPSREPEPSTRIAALNQFPLLRREGFEPHIVFEPTRGTPAPLLPDLADRLVADGIRIVVFQKVQGPSVEALARRLRARGIRTVFSICDHVIAPMVAATDATIAVTDYLKSLYPNELQSRIHVVHDGIERPQACKAEWSAGRGSRRQPLRAVLVTSGSPTQLPALGAPPDWLAVTIVGRYAQGGRPLRRLREVRWTLARQNLPERLRYLGFLLDPRIERVAWDPADVYERLLGADIGVIPIQPGNVPGADLPSATWRVKSENRLTLKMAAGLPVVATPIPSYERVIEHGVNGFLAWTPKDWQKCLAALRDPDLRRTMGERARASVLDRFGQDEQLRRLVGVLRGLLAQPERMAQR